MTTPKGVRSRSFSLCNSGQVMVYSHPEQIFLQLRHEIPNTIDLLLANRTRRVGLVKGKRRDFPVQTHPCLTLLCTLTINKQVQCRTI